MLSFSGDDYIQRDQIKEEAESLFEDIYLYFSEFFESDKDIEFLENDIIIKSRKTAAFNSRNLEDNDIIDLMEDLIECVDLLDDLPNDDSVTLINSDIFVEYIRELCIDIGDVSRNLPNYISIDWERTAENLMNDYGEIEVYDTTYYYLNQ